jgi:hypothetical protein
MIKRKINRDMPIEMLYRQEFNEWLEVLEDVNNLFDKMNYSPDAENIHDIHNRVKDILARYENTEDHKTPTGDGNPF